LHSSHGWEGTSDLFDLRIFIASDVDKCIDRLKIRNKCIPGYTEEEIEIRCDAVDRANAMLVKQTGSNADLVVEGAAQ
jgi:hypothetical protein